ncbi:GNAT family N-acetyltransferase [Saccharopolyspora taberi]|uniref:GNAT family N-acetyltransferase n=1 Tax=Saccharopolyspora taberi TaxID=60895 RepID=UPI003CD08861
MLRHRRARQRRHCWDDCATAFLASRVTGPWLGLPARVRRRGQVAGPRTGRGPVRGPAGRATAGYSVAPAHRGRGVASAALKAMTSFAWSIAELHRIELYVEPRNRASCRVAETAGYEREGLLRSHQEIGGIRRDMLLYAAIRRTA